MQFLSCFAQVSMFCQETDFTVIVTESSLGLGKADMNKNDNSWFLL